MNIYDANSTGSRREFIERAGVGVLKASGLLAAAELLGGCTAEQEVGRQTFEEFKREALTKPGILDSWYKKLRSNNPEEALYNMQQRLNIPREEIVNSSRRLNSNSQVLLDGRAFANSNNPDNFKDELAQALSQSGLDGRVEDYQVVLERQPQVRLLTYSKNYGLNTYQASLHKADFGSSGSTTKSKNQTLLDRILYQIWNYKAIDEYLNWESIRKGKLGKIAYGILLYPADFALDMGIRTPKAIFCNIPVEAWKRTMEAAELQSMQLEEVDNDIIRIGLVPLQLVTGAANFIYNYGAIVVKGTIEQVTKKPLETITHGLLSALFYEAIRKEFSGRGSSDKVIVVEEPPPGPPIGPPGQPWWQPP